MSSNLVIVALPAQDDPVWKVSSEKKPHLTICFLGDAESNPNVERIVEFVDHAVTVCEHGPFYMTVDRRDVLGPDQADVLFFEKRYSFKWIDQFRNQLLQNTDIRAAYESVDQYEEWTPHLTLGYPPTPAHEDKMPEYGLSMVSFDRIAVWTGDFDGPEFRLEWPERDYGDLAVAYSSMNQERAKMGLAAIEHHGVKGMRWGRRGAKDTAVTVNGKTKQVTAKKAARLDQRFVKNTHSVNTFIAVHNKAAEATNAHDIERINNKPEYKNKDFTKPSPLRDKYYKEHADAFNNRLQEAATSIKSPTGKKQYDVHIQNDGSWNVTVKDVKHAAGDPTSFIVKIAFDADGYITKIEPQDSTDSMAQTAFIDDYLAHYGIKGMRWGQRKSSEVTPTSVHVKTTPHNRKATKVEVKGGAGHDAHPDAIKVAEARQKMRKSGTAALSNSELKNVAERLQLESNVARLEGERKSGSTFVGKLLRKHGSQQLDRGINRAAGTLTDEAATRVGKAATKKVFQAGVAAAL